MEKKRKKRMKKKRKKVKANEKQASSLLWFRSRFSEYLRGDT